MFIIYTTIQILGSVIFSKINYYFDSARMHKGQQSLLHYYNGSISISNKLCYFELSTQRILKQCIQVSIKNIKQHNCFQQ